MTGQEILAFADAHGDVNAESLAFSPDGKWLASGGCDGTFKLWDLAAGREEFEHGGRGIVTSVAFSLQGNRLAWCSSGEAVLIRDADGRVQVIKVDAKLAIESLAFSADGNRLAAGGGILGRLPDQPHETLVHGHLTVWDATTGGEQHAATLNYKPIHAISISRDDNTLVVAAERSVLKWNPATGSAQELVGFSRQTYQIAISPGGEAVAASVEDGTLTIWDAHTGQTIRTLEWDVPHFSCVAFGRNGELVASDFKSVKMWNPAMGKQVLTLNTGDGDEVCSVAISADGKRLATGYVHGLVKVWELAY